MCPDTGTRHAESPVTQKTARGLHPFDRLRASSRKQNWPLWRLTGPITRHVPPVRPVPRLSPVSSPFDVELQLERHATALRRLAGALLRNAHDADDAVQEVWVAALREPPPHDSAPGGWLRTVLMRVVGKFRRSASRRELHEIAATRPELSPDQAPDQAAMLAHQEMAKQLMAAVFALEPAYRDTIWQRFFEGRSPQEIASTSGIPIATVRSRLQRGVGSLRARLGEGTATDWRPGLAVAFGLGTGAPPAVSAGGAFMGAAGFGVASAALAAALAIGVLAWQSDGGGPTPSSGRAGPGGAPSVASGSSSAGGPADVALQREVVAQAKGSAEAPPPAAAPPASAEVPVAPAALPLAVRGRVVDADTGSPLPGVQVVLRSIDASELQLVPNPHAAPTSRPDAGPAAVGLGPARTTASRVGESARDGQFAIPAAVAGLVEVRVTAPQRVGWVWQGSLDSARRTLDLGELRMRAGRLLRGRVVVGDGSSLAGRMLMAHFAVASSGMAKEIRAGTRIRSDGTFELAAPVPFGEVQWRLGAGALLATTPTVTQVTAESGEVELQVASPQSIRGRVVDRDGKPVAGVAISDPFLAETVRSGADGSFVVRRGELDRAPATMLRVLHAESWQAHPPLRGVPWGTTDLVVRLTPLPPFELRVVDEAGQPVVNFGIALQREGLSPFFHDQVQHRGRHRGGVLPLPSVQPGATWLRVLPTDPEFAPSERVAVPAVGDAAMTVVLARMRPMPIRVVDGGQPVAGLQVELLRRRNGAELAEGDLAVDPRRGRRCAMSARLLERLDGATTGTDGMAMLRRGPDLTDCVLRLHRDGDPDGIVRDLVPPPDGSPLVVALPHHGDVHGTVRSPSVPFADLRIAVLGTRHRAGQSLPVAADGTFVVEDLPYGEHTLLVQRRVLVAQGVFGSLLPMRVVKIDVDAARVAVTLDLADLPLAQLRGAVRPGERLPADYAIDLWRERDDGTMDRAATTPLAADGTFVFDQLLPGTYRASFRRGSYDPRALAGLHAERFVVAAGEHVALTLAHRPQRFVLRLTRPDGTAIVGERVQLRCGGGLWPTERYQLPLVDGELVLDPAPTLPIEVRGGEPGAPWSAPVVMPPDVAEATATVVVPFASGG